MIHNEINEEIYEISTHKHRHEGGIAPMAYALTEIIKKSIKEKDYKIYSGGGPYGDDGEWVLKRFDVVVTFTLGNDPEFWVVMDHDLDFCDLYRSDSRANLLKKMF
jgi:hypothetical protein